MSGSFYVTFTSQVSAVFPSLADVFTLATLIKMMEGCDALHAGGGGDFHRALGGCLGGEMR